MRNLVHGMTALALVASAAAFAADEDDARVATAESMTPSFTRLDADTDGRISAIEAANNSKVAAGFTSADANKDGYLSKAEYAQLVKAASSGASPQSQSSRTDQAPSEDAQAVPAQK
jgi:Ca2+-binding EF-hand superfamily protein